MQFYAGMDRDLTEEEERIIEKVATSEVSIIEEQYFPS
jgi:hypothetical protein